MYFLYSTQCRRLLPHVVSTVARTSLPHHCWNPQGFSLVDCPKTCFPAIGICKKPVSLIHDVIVIRGTSGLQVIRPSLCKDSTGINTRFSALSRSAEAERQIRPRQAIGRAESEDKLYSLDSAIIKREITAVIAHIYHIVPTPKD